MTPHNNKKLDKRGGILIILKTTYRLARWLRIDRGTLELVIRPVKLFNDGLECY